MCNNSIKKGVPSAKSTFFFFLPCGFKFPLLSSSWPAFRSNFKLSNYLFYSLLLVAGCGWLSVLLCALHFSSTTNLEFWRQLTKYIDESSRQKEKREESMQRERIFKASILWSKLSDIIYIWIRGFIFSIYIRSKCVVIFFQPPHPHYESHSRTIYIYIYVKRIYIDIISYKKKKFKQLSYKKLVDFVCLSISPRSRPQSNPVLFSPLLYVKLP